MLEESLAKYQKALASTESPKERQILRGMIEDLNRQKEKMQQSQGGSQDEQKKVRQKYEEFITKSTKLIFDHYSRQTFSQGKSVTFERVGHETTVWNYGTFISFCKHFGILQKGKFSRDEAIHMFKRVNHKEMDFKDFQKVL